MVSLCVGTKPALSCSALSFLNPHSLNLHSVWSSFQHMRSLLSLDASSGRKNFVMQSKDNALALRSVRESFALSGWDRQKSPMICGSKPAREIKGLVVRRSTIVLHNFVMAGSPIGDWMLSAAARPLAAPWMVLMVTPGRARLLVLSSK